MQLKIENISNLGYGIAFDEKKQKIFIPKSVNGDEIEAHFIKKTNKFNSAKIDKIIKKSQHRKEASCQYFEKCGGCVLQHLKEDFYQNFKISNIKNALNKNDISYFEDLKFVKIGEKSRRRAIFHVNKKNEIGFFALETNDVVKINNCIMLESELENLIPQFQNLLKSLPNGLISQISACKFDNVIDAILFLNKGDISLEINEILIQFAKNQLNINLNISEKGRISPIFQRSKPQINLGNLKIDVPNNIFLQATKDGQDYIISQITSYLKKTTVKNVVDLYCGIGTYSFPIIDLCHKIKAFEGEDSMTNSINNNAKKLGINHKIIATSRDLVVNPLRVEELKDIDLAILNPPRNGAKSQIEKIAQSQIKNLIMVSCNLNSFVDDAKILIASGFKMKNLTAIDQFLYTSHIELIAIFER